MLQVDVEGSLVMLVRSSLGWFCCCSWNWRKQMYYSIDGYWNDSFQIKTNFCRMLVQDQIEVKAKTTVTDEIIPLQRRPVVCLTIFTERCLSIKHKTINMIQHVCHPSIFPLEMSFPKWKRHSHCPTARGPPLAACPFAEVTGVCNGLCVRWKPPKKTSLHETFDSCWWHSTLLAGFGLHFPKKEHINGRLLDLSGNNDPFAGSCPVWDDDISAKQIAMWCICVCFITSNIYHPCWNQKPSKTMFRSNCSKRGPFNSGSAFMVELKRLFAPNLRSPWLWRLQTHHIYG